MELSELDSHFVCEILNNKYQYHHKDWFSGDELYFDLEVCLGFWEEKQMKKIRSGDCKVVLDKLPIWFFFRKKNVGGSILWKAEKAFRL